MERACLAGSDRVLMGTASRYPELVHIFVLCTAEGWERTNGAAVVVAETLERVQELMREYEAEEGLVCYSSARDAEDDLTGPFRHQWIEVERFDTDDKRERVVISSWDERL